MTSEEDAYHALCAYTLAHGDASFIHQHVVDAWAAQTARPDSKPISVAFSLAGLYLHVEKGFSGRQVQRAHMQMARHKRAWPVFDLPADRGSVTVRDVMNAREGPERDAAIEHWCASVWAAYAQQRDAVVAFVRQYGVL